MPDLHYLRPGDWLTLVAGAAVTAWLFAALWQTDRADRAIVRSGGKVVGEYSLAENRSVTVHGPLGTSLITIQAQRARVAQDPSPRQYCVKQGWLSRQGEMAVCLPNQVSVELAGSKKLYDSLSY
ncbi:MAG: NusG domain II-containing protein [Sulfuricella sp.]|nr:NusG domain II-containing protein [Sulfuricella sp.]